MPKRKPEPVEEDNLEVEDFRDDQEQEYEEYDENVWQRAPLWLRLSGSAIVLAIILAASFEFVYADKIYPGVTADGVDVGGLSKTDAAQRISGKISTFTGSVITISSGSSNLRIPVASLAT